MKKLCMFVIFPILVIYMIYRAHHDKISYQTILDSNLPDELNGYCIFFISDIHRRRIRKKTLNLISKQIDTIIIGGDLTEKYVPFRRTRSNIQKLKLWDAPICFVWGNNDEEVGRDQLTAFLKEEGVFILANDHIDIHRRSKVITLMGLNFPPSNQQERINIVLNKANKDYTIFLTHVPLLYSELSQIEKEKVNVILSAHTHGGQIRIFGLGPYERGSLTTFGSTSILVSEGYGYSIFPFRLGTNAEFHVLTLHNK